jgi:large subunit ribosomal protein L3
MINGILGKKLGMMQQFTEDGAATPVTVIQAGPCHVMQIKTTAKDGYEALQLGFDDRKRKNAKKPQIGHARKAKTEPKRFTREVMCRDESQVQLGGLVTLAALEGVRVVDVIGTSKGRGFQGVVKRHHFHGRPATHGASKDHRAPGSIGSTSTPGRALRGKRMAGHLGSARRTVRNLRVVSLDKERHLILVRGSVPGPTGGYVIVRRASAPRRASDKPQASSKA